MRRFVPKKSRSQSGTKGPERAFPAKNGMLQERQSPPRRCTSRPKQLLRQGIQGKCHCRCRHVTLRPTGFGSHPIIARLRRARLLNESVSPHDSNSPSKVFGVGPWY